MQDDDPPLPPRVLPTGGTFDGLLIEFPTRPMALYWAFRIDCEESFDGYEMGGVSVTVDYVPNLVPSWRRHAGVTYRGTEFGNQIEASVYFFNHHRYDTVELSVLAQRGTSADIAVLLAGDIDDLGLPQVQVRATVEFTGIIVSGNDSHQTHAARQRLLSTFTDTADLIVTPSPGSAAFKPRNPTNGQHSTPQ